MKYAIILCLLAITAVFAEEVPNDKCTDVYDECVKETGEGPVARFKCGIKYLECRLGDIEAGKVNFGEIFDGENDKCTDVYDECVKATGEDPVSRFKCGIKYLECRLGGSMEFDELEEILKSKLFDKENDKCIDVYNQCVKETGEGPIARFKCGMKYLKCRLGNSMEFKKLEAFLPDDKCTDVYDECVKETGKDPISRLKCGVKYLECRLGRDGKDDLEVNCEKTSYAECLELSFGSMQKCFSDILECKQILFQRKLACVKKCKDDAQKCAKTEETEDQVCFKNGYSCVLKCGQ